VIRVLLLEDAQSLRRGLARQLNAENGIVVIGNLDIENIPMPLARRLWPRVVVVNADMMVSQLLPILDELKAHNPSSATLILSDPSKRGTLPPRRRARELSFLVKGSPAPVLAQAIRRIAGGERVVDPRLEVASLAAGKSVSTRELEILGLAAEGESVADIARRLYLSLGTVRNYLSSAIAKTGARNRMDAIRIVRKDGWLR
jgi:two-component system, NarL family, response regulator DesR